MDSSGQASTSLDFLSDPNAESRLCLVCSDKSDGAHFGIDSCRACAAFFRRSVVMKKRYVCRQGGNKCDINKSVRCMCRKCRLRKCLEAGMLPESVQSKRDPIVPRGNDSDPLTATNSQTASDNELTFSLQPVTAPPQQQLPHLPLPFIDAPILSQPDQPYMLQRLKHNYQHLCAVRKSTEMSMNPSYIRTMFDGAASTASDGELQAGSCKKTMDIYLAQLPATGEFVSNSFDEFHTLSQDEKWTIFQSFVLTMWVFDGAYRTYTMVSPENYETRTVMTETTYIDMNKCEEFIEDAPSAMSNISKADLSKMLRERMGRPRVKMIKAIADLALTEDEYVALLALAVWNPNNDKSTDKIDKICKEIRTRIFVELGMLFRMNGMDDYSARMGEIVLLFSSIMHNVGRLREDVEMFNLFDLFGKDTFLYELCKGAGRFELNT